MRYPSLLYCALALPSVAAAQNNRTMVLSAPVVIGQTAGFTLVHPATAAGNGYVFLLTVPQYPVVQSIVVPGFVVNGLLRIDPLNFQDLFVGVLSAAGTVTNTIGMPNDPLLVGITFDLQAVDLASATNTLTLADNELSLLIAGAAPTTMNMVPIAAGTFSMGSNASTASPYFSAGNERPVHAVTITRPFWMGKYEVTQAEYQAVMGSNPSFFVGANLPVETVSWTSATAYCAALSVQEAAAGRLPSGYVYRLPTEAEWEYCCRAGTTTEFNVGASLSCTQANHFNGTNWCVLHPALGGQTTAVGSYAANAFGLHDMHGNVWEWCRDSWDGSVNYPTGGVSDPVVTSGPGRVGRGGGWNYFSFDCRAAYRGWGDPAYAFANVGFRVVLAPVL